MFHLMALGFTVKMSFGERFHLGRMIEDSSQSLKPWILKEDFKCQPHLI